MSDLTSRTEDDFRCEDCHISIPKNGIFRNGLCQMCNAELNRHLATLERWEADRG
jgi:hypothetical protein